MGYVGCFWSLTYTRSGFNFDLSFFNLSLGSPPTLWKCSSAKSHEFPLSLCWENKYKWVVLTVFTSPKHWTIVTLSWTILVLWRHSPSDSAVSSNQSAFTFSYFKTHVVSITLSDHILSVDSFLAFNISWIHYESVPAHMSAHITVNCQSISAKHHLSINVFWRQCSWYSASLLFWCSWWSFGGLVIWLELMVPVILPRMNISIKPEPQKYPETMI